MQSITRSESMPSRSPTAARMRALAWWKTNRPMSSSSSPARSTASAVDSDSRCTAALKVSWPCMRMIWSARPARMASAPAPSACSAMCPISPGPPFAGLTTLAPAPSAKSAAVPRSVLSTKRLSTSAAIGSTSSGATVARSTRSRSSGSTPASSSAARPAAAASASRRSPSRTWRRSRTPVRWTIHCSVTPAPAATVSLVTTLSGTTIATDARAAERGRRVSRKRRTAPSPGTATDSAGAPSSMLAGLSRSSFALRTGGLHRERRLGLRALERLAHEVREDSAGTGLDVAGGAEILQRAHHIGPADRADDRLHELLAQILERRGRDAGEDRHARRAHLHVFGETPEGLDRRLHERGMECAGHGEALRAHALLAQQGLGLVESREGARQHELVGGVVVGDGEVRPGGHLLHRRAVARADGEHAAVAGLLGGLLHEAAAGGHQPEPVLGV